MPGGQEWEEKVLDVDPAAMRKLLSRKANK
jgi:hypothetical protein